MLHDHGGGYTDTQMNGLEKLLQSLIRSLTYTDIIFTISTHAHAAWSRAVYSDLFGTGSTSIQYQTHPSVFKSD